MNEMLQVKFVELDKIIPYVNNPKAHPDDQIKKIASSIKEFGFKVPIIVDKDFVIIAGHGRYYAAKLLGLDKVPVIIAEDLTPAQVKAFRIADNKVAESEWDYESLLAELEQLKDLDYDIELTGFDEEEIERLIKSVGVEEVKPDDVADDTEIEMQQHEPYSIYYDIWVLGEHKLMCGDSTKRDDVLRLMDGEKADMIITDPPYGFGDLSWFDNALTIANNDSCEIFVMNSDKYLVKLAYNYFNYFKYFFSVTLKPGILVNNNMPITAHDLIAYFRVGKTKFKNLHDAFSTAIEINKRKDGDHRHMKPVSLFEQFIMHFSDDKDLVVDLFAGSGTALIASERLGRVNYSMELNPEFVDLIVKRYIDNFGDDEVYLVRDGKKIEFDEIRDEFLKMFDM
jgi:DNA modification methylase